MSLVFYDLFLLLWLLLLLLPAREHFSSTPSSNSTRLASWSRLCQAGRSLLLRSVSDSTRKSYSSGVRLWKSFCLQYLIDPCLPRVVGHDIKQSTSFDIGVAVNFVSYLFYVRRMLPRSIRVVLSGLRFWLKYIGKDCSFLSDPILSSVCQGMFAISYTSRPSADTRTLPITVDFIMFAIKNVFNLSLPFDKCLATTFILAFTCLFRKSEYVGKYALRAHDVVFEILLRDTVRFIPSSDPSLRDMVLSMVQGVIITNRFAKSDKCGSGFRFHFHKNDSFSRISFDITSSLFQWAQLAHLQSDNSFLSFRGLWSLSYSSVQKAVKLVAQRLSLNPFRFSSHSFRVGGASVLAAAGVPDYIIMKMGRWRSLAFLDYIRESGTFFSVALSSLSNPTLFTLDHLRRINSGYSF